jgi:ureidoglycolate hydrolase
METTIDIITCGSDGYRPLVDFESWRVAFLRYADAVDRDQLRRVERHMETDEVFVLLNGRAVLIVEAGGSLPGVKQAAGYNVINMLPETVYNVRKASWHHIVVSRNACVLIVENSDTDYGNSEYRDLSHAAAGEIISLIPPL